MRYVRFPRPDDRGAKIVASRPSGTACVGERCKARDRLSLKFHVELPLRAAFVEHVTPPYARQPHQAMGHLRQAQTRGQQAGGLLECIDLRRLRACMAAVCRALANVQRSSGASQAMGGRRHCQCPARPTIHAARPHTLYALGQHQRPGRVKRSMRAPRAWGTRADRDDGLMTIRTQRSPLAQR